MEVDADDIRTHETDDQGRFYLGTEYANKRVMVAVVEIDSDRPDEDELARAYREASESPASYAVPAITDQEYNDETPSYDEWQNHATDPRDVDE